ncbi:MAG: 4Fe-4S dicluster domain-containing protein [Armatimonadota bacterium]
MRLNVVDTEICVGCQLCMFACTRRQNRAGISKSCIHVRSIGGMERGFKIIVCRKCSNPPCARSCPTEALTLKPGGGVKFNSEKCEGCGNCRNACVIGAVSWDEDMNKPLICLHCGYCTRYCPHRAIRIDKEDKNV